MGKDGARVLLAECASAAELNRLCEVRSELATQNRPTQSSQSSYRNSSCSMQLAHPALQPLRASSPEIAQVTRLTSGAAVLNAVAPRPTVPTVPTVRRAASAPLESRG